MYPYGYPGEVFTILQTQEFQNWLDATSLRKHEIYAVHRSY
jgi:hypothetical protein